MFVLQSSLIKVVAAFVVGVVVAVGSALIYVRATDRVYSQPAVETTPLPAQSLPAQLPDTRQASVTQPAPPQAAPALDNRPVKREPVERPKHRKPATEAHREIVKPILHDVAQNTPPVMAAPPPVNEEQEAPTATPPPPVETDPAPAPVQQQQEQPHVVTLPSGTNLIVRLGERLSTNDNYTGDTFRATLESPIVMDGFIIADKGSKVLGRIVNARKAGRVEGVSGLTLALSEINTTDGQRVPVQSTTYARQGPVNTGENAAKIAGGAALGAIIGAIAGGGRGAAIGAGAGGAAGTGAVLVTRGRPAVLPVETPLTFRLAAPVTITEKLNN